VSLGFRTMSYFGACVTSDIHVSATPRRVESGASSKTDTDRCNGTHQSRFAGLPRSARRFMQGRRLHSHHSDRAPSMICNKTLPLSWLQCGRWAAGTIKRNTRQPSAPLDRQNADQALSWLACGERVSELASSPLHGCQYGSVSIECGSSLRFAYVIISIPKEKARTRGGSRFRESDGTAKGTKKSRFVTP